MHLPAAYCATVLRGVDSALRIDNRRMPTQSAPPIIERKVTAWHEAGHVIVVLLSKHFDIGDPAIDLRPSSRGHAYAGTKRLFVSPRVTDAEAREIVKIAYAGSVGQDWLELVSRDQGPGQAIYPDPANASGDLAMADSVLAQHGLETEREALWTAAQDAIGDHVQTFMALAEHVWRSPSDVLSRADLLAIPEIAELVEKVQKVSPLLPAQELAAANDRPVPDAKRSVELGEGPAPTAPVGLWRRICRFLGFQ